MEGAWPNPSTRAPPQTLQAAPPPPLTAVVATLTAGLRLPEAAGAAAQALRAMCARCADVLCQPALLPGEGAGPGSAWGALCVAAARGHGMHACAACLR